MHCYTLFVHTPTSILLCWVQKLSLIFLLFIMYLYQQQTWIQWKCRCYLNVCNWPCRDDPKSLEQALRRSPASAELSRLGSRQYQQILHTRECENDSLWYHENICTFSRVERIIALFNPVRLINIGSFHASAFKKNLLKLKRSQNKKKKRKISQKHDLHRTEAVNVTRRIVAYIYNNAPEDFSPNGPL